MTNMVDILEDYEEGYLDTQGTLELFAELIRTGTIWHQRLSHRRTADGLISARYVTLEGKITAKGRALILDEGREGSPCDANPELTELEGELEGASDKPIPGPFAVPNVSGDGTV
jgi:hypothetical protein